jgi:hypothetical protein
MRKEVKYINGDKEKKAPRKNTAPVRLWVKAAFTGFRRSRHT